MFVSSNSTQRELNDLKLALERINTFLDSIGLELSPSKTKLCVCSYGLRKTNNLGFNFKNSFIANTNSVKFLGLGLTSTLSWTSHIQHIWNVSKSD